MSENENSGQRELPGMETKPNGDEPIGLVAPKIAFPPLVAKQGVKMFTQRCGVQLIDWLGKHGVGKICTVRTLAVVTCCRSFKFELDGVKHMAGRSVGYFIMN